MIKKISKIILSLLSVLKSRLLLTTSGNGVLIIKIDAIGDFFMLLNCLVRIPEHLLLKPPRMTIICSNSLVEIGVHFLPKINWIGLDKVKFENSSEYRKVIYKLIKAAGPFEKAANLAYSRDWISDLLVANANSHVKLGAFGDRAKQGRASQLLGSLIYDQKINGDFCTEYGFLDLALRELFGEFSKYEVEKNEEPKGDYIVIFPGASWFGKAWSGKSFFKVIEKILDSSDLNVYICGGTSDIQYAMVFEPLFGERVINMIGKTSLIELCETIKKARAIVTNDTSAAHIAQFFQVEGVAIIGGGHFGRFLPYGRFDSLKIVNKKMDCYGCNWNCKFDHGQEPVPCISQITSEEVIQTLQRFL